MQEVIIYRVHSGVFPPLVRLEIEPNGTNVIGKDYSLTCTAMTDIPGDTFEFSWYHIINTDNKKKVGATSELSFRPLKSSDKGKYTCECSLKQEIASKHRQFEIIPLGCNW